MKSSYFTNVNRQILILNKIIVDKSDEYVWKYYGMFYSCRVAKMLNILVEWNPTNSNKTIVFIPALCASGESFYIQVLSLGIQGYHVISVCLTDVSSNMLTNFRFISLITRSTRSGFVGLTTF